MDMGNLGILEKYNGRHTTQKWTLELMNVTGS